MAYVKTSDNNVAEYLSRVFDFSVIRTGVAPRTALDYERDFENVVEILANNEDVRVCYVMIGDSRAA